MVSERFRRLAPQARDRWLVAWALASVAIGGASLLVPLYVVALGAGPLALGGLAAAAAFAGVPGSLVVGRLADRTGRYRAYVLGSLVAVTVTLAVLPLTERVGVVVAANAVVWFAVAAVGPVLTLLVVAGEPEATWQRRIASLNAWQGWGWTGGLVLGAAWSAVGLQFAPVVAVQQSFFVGIAATAAAATIWLARTLPVPETRPPPRRFARALARARRPLVRGATFPFVPSRLVLLHPSRLRSSLARFSTPLLLYLGAAFVFFAGSAAFFAPLPAFLTDAGYDSGVVFALYLVNSLGSAAFFVGAGELAGRHDLSLLQAAGLAVRAVGFPAFALVASTTLVGVVLTGGLFALVGVTWAVIAVTATTIVTRLAPATVRGEALGVYAAVGALAGGVGGLLGGALAARDYLLAFLVAGALVAVGAGLVVVMRSLTGPEGADVAQPAGD